MLGSDCLWRSISQNKCKRRYIWVQHCPSFFWFAAVKHSNDRGNWNFSCSVSHNQAAAPVPACLSWLMACYRFSGTAVISSLLLFDWNTLVPEEERQVKTNILSTAASVTLAGVRLTEGHGGLWCLLFPLRRGYLYNEMRVVVILHSFFLRCPLYSPVCFLFLQGSLKGQRCKTFPFEQICCTSENVVQSH